MISRSSPRHSARSDIRPSGGVLLVAAWLPIRLVGRYRNRTAHKHTSATKMPVGSAEKRVTCRREGAGVRLAVGAGGVAPDLGGGNGGKAAAPDSSFVLRMGRASHWVS